MHNKFVCVFMCTRTHVQRDEEKTDLRREGAGFPEQKGGYQEGKNSRSWEGRT